MPKKTKQSGKLLSCVWGCGPLDAGESAKDHAASCPLNNKFVCTTCLERFSCQASVESHASDKHGWSDKDVATHWRDDRGNEEILKEPAFLPPTESRTRAKRKLPSRESSLESASNLVVPAESGTKRTVEKSRAYSPGSSVVSRATRSTECELRELENTLLREKVDLQARQLEAQGKQIETLQQELAFHRQMGERFMSWMDSSMHKPTSDGLPSTSVAQQMTNNATTSVPVTKSTAGCDSSDVTSQVPKKVEKSSTKDAQQTASNSTASVPVAKTTANSGTAVSQVLKKSDKSTSKTLDKTVKTPDKPLKGDEKKSATSATLAPQSTSDKMTTSKTKSEVAKKETAKEKTVVGEASAVVDKLKQKATVVLARTDALKPAAVIQETTPTESQSGTEKQTTPQPKDKPVDQATVKATANANAAVRDSEAVVITDDVDLDSTSGASVSGMAPPKANNSASSDKKAERVVAVKDQTMEVSFAASRRSEDRSEDRGREGSRRDERHQDRHRRSPSRHGRQRDRSPARRDRTPPRRSPRRSSPSRRSPSRARTQRREPSTNRQSTSTIGSSALLPRKANMEVVLALEDSEMLELTRGTSLDALFALETKELVRRVQDVKDRLRSKTTRA